MRRRGLFFVLLLWVVVEAIGWLVLPVVVLRGIDNFGTELGLLHIQLRRFPFGVNVDLGTERRLLS
jgi:hypothetical protein